MKLLYVVGACLTRNTSANISHNAYVQGFLEHGCDVEILMARSSWGQQDAGMPVWSQATYRSYRAESLADSLRAGALRLLDGKEPLRKATSPDGPKGAIRSGQSRLLKKHIRNAVRSVYRFAVDRPTPYRLERTWLKTAQKFRSKVDYDLIVSNSSPAASHKLVLELLSRKGISGKRWIQIWEDPWYYDLYGGHTDREKLEEHRLLRAASEVFYVSPLTLEYQKAHFPDCADKMKYIPLPYLKLAENNGRGIGNSPCFGYFGDYYSVTRNLVPLYKALEASGARACIYGDSDLSLETTRRIEICGRVTLDKLAKVQEQTDVLVHLCNLRGGQIPGKIYHYSATTKPILFILDGTPNEIIKIRECFEKYNRYHFCENCKESILDDIESLLSGQVNMNPVPVHEFSPDRIAAQLVGS